ncbi:YbaN family protein [Dubosiella newyorkensis]|uniref:YbaN family protein n=1 Tax=Dubosiella newyorkensis TaxID=1862672 RepID=UPI0027311AAC|nr:YbaN family protein [Dubosiella newyorkensis]
MKIVYLLIGFIGRLGVLGALLPLLPAFPFLLLAAFGFARSSKRLNDWFLSTNLYKDNLESWVKERGMHRKAKIRVMAIITMTMALGFIMMGSVPVGQVILLCVWIGHVLYFKYGIKTLESE